MEEIMDRRQRKTREAILKAFRELLSQKPYAQITVGDIIRYADVGRATFYAHFETKDFLLKALCEDLFCHLFDSLEQNGAGHHHIFECDAPDSVMLHLIQHMQNNDNGILTLLRSENNGVFLTYFQKNLIHLIQNQRHLFAHKKAADLPEDFWVHHISVTFVETIRWWIANGMKESPEVLTSYFMMAIGSGEFENALEKYEKV